MKHWYRPRPFVAGCAVVALVVNPSMPLVMAATQTAAAPQTTAKPVAAKPPAAKPATAQATAPKSAAANTAPPPVDGGWPRYYDLPSGGSLLIYQPQIASWDQHPNSLGHELIAAQLYEQLVGRPELLAQRTGSL